MKRYNAKDIEKMFEGQEKLHEIERKVLNFWRVLSGVIKSKKFPVKTCIINNTKPFIGFNLLLVAVGNEIYLKISSEGKNYTNLDSLNKKLILCLYKSLPEILSRINEEFPKITEDIDFIISLAVKKEKE